MLSVLSLAAGLAVATSFRVLDVGPPRTGTQTLKVALEAYGFHALHTSYNYTARLPWCDYLFGGGPLEPALRTLDGYDAAMDEPFHLVYREVMEAFPEAKFLLPVTDPDAWYDNVAAAGQELAEDLDQAVSAHRVLSGFDYLAAMTLRQPSMRTREWGLSSALAQGFHLRQVDLQWLHQLGLRFSEPHREARPSSVCRFLPRTHRQSEGHGSTAPTAPDRLLRRLGASVPLSGPADPRSALSIHRRLLRPVVLGALPSPEF
eukprot:s1962_g14.t1